MKKLLGMSTATMLALSSPVLADGYYNVIGPHGDKWGEISFEKTVGDDTVWVWPNEEGEVIYYINNPEGSRGDWSKGVYEGYFTVELPDELTTPCSYAINDPYGHVATEWGTVRITWQGSDQFSMQTWSCDSHDIQFDVVAQYEWNPQANDPVVPVAATLGLQSDRIPLSYDDPAYTVQGLDKNPAIYLEVEFSDGTRQDYDYKKFQAANIVFDDVSGDPNDIIQINYWDIDSNNPGLGQYAAQLTSTGNGVGTAQLYVSFRDAPHVTASVSATVVSAIPQVKAPVSGSLALQSYILPISRSDPAYTVSQLDIVPAIYVSAKFDDGTSLDHSYHQDFAENVIIDDVSGDPYDLIEVVEWPIDSNNHNEGNFAGQLTSTGRGTGTAYLMLSFKNAPGVTASIAVQVVSGTN